MKVLSIIQARTTSTRLPNKVLMTIQQKPILQHIINFLKHSQLTDQIIVATTTLPEDNKIEELVKNLGIDCYRGNSTDLLTRYYECARFFKGDIIVRITADNPLVDPLLIDQTISICKETGCDYCTNLLHPTYPTGYSAEAFKFSILKKLHETQTNSLSREHVTYHMRQNPHLYNVKEIFAPSDLIRPNWRLTIDYAEDFLLISEIFSRLYKENTFIDYRSVVNLLDKNPNLLKINKMYC